MKAFSLLTLHAMPHMVWIFPDVSGSAQRLQGHLLARGTLMNRSTQLSPDDSAPDLTVLRHRAPAREMPKQHARQLYVAIGGACSADEPEAGVYMACSTHDAAQASKTTRGCWTGGPKQGAGSALERLQSVSQR